MEQLQNKATITSLELVEQINIFRGVQKEKEPENRLYANITHDSLLRVIRDEFEQEISLSELTESNYKSDRGQIYPLFNLTLNQAKQVLVRESKIVRKAIITYIEKLEAAVKEVQKPKELTTLEIIKIAEIAELGRLEAIKRAEEVEGTVHILTHVNKTYTTTKIAKELGMKSAKQLNQLLHDIGIQFLQNDTWVLYSKYTTFGYTQIKQSVLDSGKIVYDRRWTGIGREFLIKLLNDNTSLENI